MSKGGGGEFKNLSGRRFRKPDKIDLMSQSSIFEIFDEDISTVLGQITDYRVNHGRYPTYLGNAFANLSTALWFKNYVKDNTKVTKKGKLKSELSEDDLESLRYIIADAYKKSVVNTYSGQTIEFEDRNKLLTSAFLRLTPEQHKLAKKFKLGDEKTRELLIQIYGAPVDNMKFVCKLIDGCPSDMSDKKKLKLLKKLYGDRFYQAVGAAMTITKNDSDTIGMLFDFMRKSKKKKRAKMLLEYAIAFKKNKSVNFRMTEPKFYKKNKEFFKELVEVDIGFKKAKKAVKSKKDDKDKNEISFNPKKYK